MTRTLPSLALRISSVIALAANVACAPTETGNAGDPAEIVLLTGIYFVPERSDVSTYPVGEVEWARAGDEVLFSYGLPRMLVGNSIRVQLAGSVAPDGRIAELSGPVGTARCTLDDEGLPLECEETFNDLDIDLDRVREEAEDEDPTRVEERVGVATAFREDPIGVFERTGLLSDVTATTVCASAADCDGVACHADVPDAFGYCEVHGDGAAGDACESSFDCAAGLECEGENGSSLCAAAD